MLTQYLSLTQDQLADAIAVATQARDWDAVAELAELARGVPAQAHESAPAPVVAAPAPVATPAHNALTCAGVKADGSACTIPAAFVNAAGYCRHHAHQAGAGAQVQPTAAAPAAVDARLTRTIPAGATRKELAALNGAASFNAGELAQVSTLLRGRKARAKSPAKARRCDAIAADYGITL